MVHFLYQKLFCSRIQIQDKWVVLPHGGCLLNLSKFLRLDTLPLLHLLNLHQLLLLLGLELFQDLHYLQESVLWSHLDHPVVVWQWLAILIDGWHGEAAIKDLNDVMFEHLSVSVLLLLS